MPVERREQVTHAVDFETFLVLVSLPRQSLLAWTEFDRSVACMILNE
jgi:hypothetical protein